MSNKKSYFPGDATYLIEQRLKFVEIISSLKGNFSDRSLVTGTPYGGWTHPWVHFDSLRNYLLLTCFDLLGQPDEWVDFNQWLSSRSLEDERNRVLATLCDGGSPVEATKEMHLAYTGLYGVRKSFFRFLDEVIPQSVLDDLLFSVKVRRIDRERNVEIAVLEAPEKKKAFLFKIRNNYTHRAIEAGSPSGAVSPELDEPIVIDGVKKWGYHSVYWEHQIMLTP